MNGPLSPVRKDVISALAGLLRPIVRILLRSGLGFAEFSSVSKMLFVEAATQDFGLRGRPTNASRVASLTGLSRREVKRIRTIGDNVDWNPGMESSPINNVIHYWHFDPEFSVSPGKPRPLSTKGQSEFSLLVKRYARDVPASVLKKELLTTGTAEFDDQERIFLVKRYFQSEVVNDDLLRNVLFALKNHAGTACHNYSAAGSSESDGNDGKRFERSAWTTNLLREDVDEFHDWVKSHGQSFLEHADDWIGNREVRQGYCAKKGSVVGVGVYFFETNTATSGDGD